MDPKERLEKAIEVLGGPGKCQVVKKGRNKGGKKRIRKLESFIQRKPEMNRTIYNQCAKKHRYRTQADATRHMHILQVIRPEKELRCYYCDECLGWHITSKPRHKPGAVRQRYHKLKPGRK